MAWGKRVAVALLAAADLAAGLTAITTGNINYAVYYWINSRSWAESEYGHISTWDTSGVTNMAYLFCGASYSSYCGYKSYHTSSARYFNDDISAWDVSRVTSMYSMFYYAQSFNKNLGWCVETSVSLGSFYSNSGCSYYLCGITRQSYCPPPTPSPTPAATGFVYVSSTMTYSSALSYCRTYHIDLASIHSSIENAAVAALCTNGYGCWIGGSDEASEGTWTWSCLLYTSPSPRD